MTVRPIFIRIEPSYLIDNPRLLLYNKCCRRALYIRRAVWLHLSKGGDSVRVTMTFHVGIFTISIVVKSGNRHSAK